MGRSPAAAGRKGDRNQADPADLSAQLWEDETEMWPAVGSWFRMGPDGFAQGTGARVGERRRRWWKAPDSASSVLLGWLAKPGCSVSLSLVWWCVTRGSVVPSRVVPELVVLELVQTEAVGANWGFWDGCLGCRAAGLALPLSSTGIQDQGRESHYPPCPSYLREGAAAPGTGS